MASTSVSCTNCGATTESVPGVRQNVMYLNYSHPQYGGGGLYFCLANGCADQMLTLLGVLPMKIN